jgi:hypothetical protein
MIPKSDREIIESLKCDLAVAAARTIEQAEMICELRKQLAELRSGVTVWNLGRARAELANRSRRRY